MRNGGSVVFKIPVNACVFLVHIIHIVATVLGGLRRSGEKVRTPEPESVFAWRHIMVVVIYL